jgi:hypothetical protein
MRPLTRIRATDLRSREFGAAFGAAGVNGEVVRHSAQRAPRRRLGGFSGHQHVQIGPWVGPSSVQIGMGQHLAVVGEQPRDSAEGPRLERLDPQLRAIDRVGVLPTLQSVPGTPIPNSPYCEAPSTSATRRCEALRAVRVAACPVHSVRDRRSYNVARRFQCPLAFSGSSRATIELQLPNPTIGEITSLKGSWPPHARRPSRSSRRSNDFASDPLRTGPPKRSSRRPPPYLARSLPSAEIYH